MSSAATCIETGQHNSGRFILCNDQHCSKKFKYTDWVIHTKIDGPHPRDHFASERTFLSWLRTGMTLVLIGFMTLLDVRQLLAPSKGLPWSHEDVPYKTRIVAFVFIGLGLASILVSLVTYFKNQYRIVNQLLDVGHGWAGYSMALMIMLFVCFVMVVAITES
ncbi:hypothetical protein BDB00DRAFT_850404 [Zychaea mexicana]|uniref:uncharacterized protein n=1 Tax=Zychaea mexicana TaxID=64656 RepID=UPI0022FEEAA8|nr:uncharacterized protein BDB00DRAFT_850404 [Zychaea mexicana]KAI9488038.1 hypothetical protein BDB00DRAFT_850404 [Zychaea mexicana]